VIQNGLLQLGLKMKSKGINVTKFACINEETRKFLPLRDSDKTTKIIGNKKHKKLIRIK